MDPPAQKAAPEKERMIGMRRAGLAALVALLLGTGCATHHVPFTRELRAGYQLSEDQIKELQFFVSSPIVLRRNLGPGEVKVTRRNALRILRERAVEEVVIETGTPGVAERIEEHSLGISFEHGKFLEFGCKHTDEKGKTVLGSTYQLYAQDWFMNRGKVNYDGKVYYTVGDSGTSSLMVDLESAKKFFTDARYVKGRKVEKN